MLEGLINELKIDGFDKVKSEIDIKINEKKTLERNIDTLKNSVKIIKEERKKYGNQNTKLLNENDMFLNSGDVRIYIYNLREHIEIYYLWVRKYLS